MAEQDSGAGAPASNSELRPHIWFLLFLFCVVYLVNLGSLRLVKDDWASIDAFSGWFAEKGLATAVSAIVTNHWLGLEQARVFFGSWLIQFLIGFLGRFNPMVYYPFILSLHLFAALLLLRIFARVLHSSSVAAFLAAAFLVLPSSTNVLFWLNNWFFSLPFYLLILQVYLLVFPRNNHSLQIGLLFLVTSVGQFCGEQPIAMFYCSFVLFGAFTLASYRGEERRRRIMRLVWPLLGSVTLMVLYVTRVMEYSLLENRIVSSRYLAVGYVRSWFDLLGRSLWIGSDLFGSWTVPLSLRSEIVMGVSGLGIGFWFWTCVWRGLWNPPFRRTAITLLFLIAYSAAGFLPLLYGAFIGTRAGPSTRYLFVVASPLLVAGILGLIGASRLLSPRVRALASVAFPVILLYCACTTIYAINQVWGFQKALDEAIWRRIDGAFSDHIKFIVTDNPAQDQLMPHSYSDAVSDFQADWGIFGRLSSLHHRHVYVGKAAEEIPGTELLRISSYYGGQWMAFPGETLFLAYRYGPTFYGLKDARLFVFNSFDEFEAFKRREAQAER